MRGMRTKKEKLHPLRLHMMVSRLYDRQAVIGWEHLLKGRVAVGMEELQDWWKRYKGNTGTEDKSDSRETVTRALAYGMLYRYEAWKVRCKRLADNILPAKRRVLLKRVEEMCRRELDVGAEDRNMFSDRNVPKCGDTEEAMEEWLRGVENYILRRERKEQAENRKIVDYLS